jgi:hypothetical protein
MENQRSPLIATVLVAMLACAGPAWANDTESYDGGTGQWDAGQTSDWNQGVWATSSADSSSTVNIAAFTGTGGTVTVNDSTAGGAVGADFLYFNNSSATSNTPYDITGDTITLNADPGTAYLADIDPSFQNSAIVSAPIEIAENVNNETSYINNGNAVGTMTFGDINFGPAIGGTTTRTDQQLAVDGAAGSTTILNGTISTSTGIVSGMAFGEFGGSSAATYEISGKLAYALRSNKAFDFVEGTLLLGTSNLGTGDLAFIGDGYSANRSLLTSGAQTITNSIYNQGSGIDTIGGSTADLSTFTNTISTGGSTMTVTAANGGRVVFDGSIGSSSNDSIAGGLVTTGQGTVVLNSTGGNTYNLNDPRNNQAAGNQSADLHAKLTLVNNAANTSAFGNGTGGVTLEAGAGLGGTGTVTQLVTAASTSLITAGDPGQSSLGIDPSTGTLHLTGGLTATTGLTMAFKLEQGEDDSIDLGQGPLTLGGNVTLDFTSLDGFVNTSSPYQVLIGEGDWSGVADDTNFIVDGPAGYSGMAMLTFGPVNELNVSFTATPEPSTYAMLGLGLLALLGARHWMRLSRVE